MCLCTLLLTHTFCRPNATFSAAAPCCCCSVAASSTHRASASMLLLLLLLVCAQWCCLDVSGVSCGRWLLAGNSMRGANTASDHCVGVVSYWLLLLLLLPETSCSLGSLNTAADYRFPCSPALPAAVVNRGGWRAWRVQTTMTEKGRKLCCCLLQSLCTLSTTHNEAYRQ